MRLIYFCKKCAKKSVKYLDVETVQKCDTCGFTLIRKPKGGTATLVEKLDSGSSIKTLTRPAESERLTRERNKPQGDTKVKV